MAVSKSTKIRLLGRLASFSMGISDPHSLTNSKDPDARSIARKATRSRAGALRGATQTMNAINMVNSTDKKTGSIYGDN